MTAEVSIKCWKCTSKDQRSCGRAMKWCCGSREHLDLFWTKSKRSLTTSHFCKICALRNAEELRFRLGWVDTKMFRGRIFRIELKGWTWTTFRTIKTWRESHRMRTGWIWKEIVSCSSFRVCCRGTTCRRTTKSGIRTSRKLKKRMIENTWLLSLMLYFKERSVRLLKLDLTLIW